MKEALPFIQFFKTKSCETKALIFKVNGTKKAQNPKRKIKIAIYF